MKYGIAQDKALFSSKSTDIYLSTAPGKPGLMTLLITLEKQRFYDVM